MLFNLEAISKRIVTLVPNVHLFTINVDFTKIAITLVPSILHKVSIYRNLELKFGAIGPGVASYKLGIYTNLSTNIGLQLTTGVYLCLQLVLCLEFFVKLAPDILSLKYQ